MPLSDIHSARNSSISLAVKISVKTEKILCTTLESAVVYVNTTSPWKICNYYLYAWFMLSLDQSIDQSFTSYPEYIWVTIELLRRSPCLGEGGGVEPMLNWAWLRMPSHEWNIASAYSLSWLWIIKTRALSWNMIKNVTMNRNCRPWTREHESEIWMWIVNNSLS